MLAKQLLPTYGGSAAVWTTSLLFFQTALLAGYLWAHYARRSWHLVLLAFSAVVLLAWSPIPAPGNHPVVELFGTLAASIGLPFVTIAATSPLLQRWSGSAQPYRLYALSNLGSLLALLSYPPLVEPWLPLLAQKRLWTVLYLLFAVFCALCVRRANEIPAPALKRRFRFWWFALAAAPSGLLLATTNQMCQEIAPIPLLWVVPLALYLATFILCFDHPRWYKRDLFIPAASVLATGACLLLFLPTGVPLWTHLAVDSLALLCCGMLCHGELSRLRPEAGLLTNYYLAIAAGGVFGGILVIIVAPALFHSYNEYPLLLGLCLLLPLVWAGSRVRNFLIFGAGVALVAAVHAGAGENVIAARRNFYGVLHVSRMDSQLRLTHGATLHGLQFTSESERRIPTTYYSHASGAGQALLGATAPARVGVIGLGAGTLAAYGRPGDQYRFYEINPAVISLARSTFTYLSDSPASVTIVEGDARLSLQRELPQRFDYLFVDAFSSDAIPLHLLTLECADIYRKHLAPGGRLYFHISNRYLELEPVVRAVAEHLGWGIRRIDSPRDPTHGFSEAHWIVLDPALQPTPGRAVAWTDQFASLWPVLK